MDTQVPILQVAAKAVIVNDDGHVLIVREAATGVNNTKVGLYGIVGGRLEPSEAFEDGLKREAFEETGLTVEPVRPLHLGEWYPVIHGVSHQIIAIFMLCKSTAGKVRMSSEHDEYLWIDPTKRAAYDMMEPDCYAVDALAAIYGSNH